MEMNAGVLLGAMKYMGGGLIKYTGGVLIGAMKYMVGGLIKGTQDGC